MAPLVTPQTLPIPIPTDEEESDIRLIRAKVPPWLSHVEGFFSKKASRRLPPASPRDIQLELRKPLPVNQPHSYRTPPALISVVKEAIDQYLEDGFITRADVDNAAPTMLVPKGKKPRPVKEDWRFCCDYRLTNESLASKFCPMPHLSETMERIGRARYFTKIDIRQAFHRLRLTPESRAFTAFKCRYGTFVWNVLPFGLQSGPAHFQQYINHLLGNALDQYTTAYADDVLIYSDTAQEHIEHVNEIIQRLHRGGLQGDIKKSSFMATKVDYLGLVLEAGKGLSIHPNKVSAIWAWKPSDLKSRKAVRSFLGLVNFVRLFCDHASELEKPLNRLLRKGENFRIGPEEEEAMKQLQEKATTAPTLAFFHPERETILETDASNEALGAALFQIDEQGRQQPVGFFSKTLSSAETAYPIQDREMLAVIRGVEFWRPELTATPFTIITDHEALKYFSTKKLLSSRQARWGQIMSEFDYAIKYRPGKENIIADALSRKTLETHTVKAKKEEEKIGNVIDPARVAGPVLCPLSVDEPPADDEPDTLRGWRLVDEIMSENRRQHEGELRRTNLGKLWVPETSGETHLRTCLIREAHEPATRGHCGRSKTLAFLAKEYHWGGMTQDVGRYLRNCLDCRRNKIPRDKTPGLLHPIAAHEQPWHGVVVDGKEMPQDQHGYNYVWAFICRLSKFLVTLPGRKDDTAEILAKRYFRQIFGILGLPARWYSDNGPQFISGFTAYLNKATGTEHRFGTPGQAATQGAVEITNQYLDQRLRFYVNHFQNDWSEYLPALDAAHNHSQHDSLNGATPFTLMFCREPRSSLTLPIEGETPPETLPQQTAARLMSRAKVAWDTAREAIIKAQERQAGAANKKRRIPDFDEGDMVIVSKKGWSTDRPTTRLDSQWAGPYKITKRKGDSFEVDLPASIKNSHTIHASRLRKAATDPLPGQLQKPPPVELVNNEPEWVVSQILSSRIFRGKLQYQAKWTGLDPDPTFYDAESFKRAPVRIQEFHDKNLTAAGPPQRLQEWLKAAADGRDPGEHEDDNGAVNIGGSRRLRRH
jgi:hypothetical protein